MTDVVGAFAWISPTIVIGVMVASIFLALGEMELIAWRLRLAHPEVWRSLESPSVFANNVRPMQRYIRWRGAYRQLGDPLLNNLVTVRRGLAALLWLEIAIFAMVALAHLR